MEKNQHNHQSTTTTNENPGQFTGSQPGQQPPADGAAQNSDNDSAEKHERHSESSFPQQNGETLGTP